MKRLVLVCAAAACTLHGNGERVDKLRVVDSFDAVEVFDNFVTEISVDASLPVGDKMEVVVGGDANLIEHVFAGVHGPGTLSAGIDSNNLVHLDLTPELTANMPVLTSVYAEGDTVTTVTGASGEISLSLYDQARLTIAGDGALKIVVRGTARVDAQAFRASRVEVDAQGSGTLVVVCSEAEPEITGDGVVKRRCE